MRPENTSGGRISHPDNCLCPECRDHKLQDPSKNYFYMVHVEDGGAPTKKFWEYIEAQKEAERLTNTYNKRVYILQSDAYVERSAVRVHKYSATRS